jgi:hypothetical protein
MKEPTIEEIKELVFFERDDNGKLQVGIVNGDIGLVRGNVIGVYGNVSVVGGNVRIVSGNVPTPLVEMVNKACCESGIHQYCTNIMADEQPSKYIMAFAKKLLNKN